MRGRATIKDVAERAGCSVSTVSRALNGTGRIGEEMRSRVRDAAEALSFSFDAIGRSLQSQKSFTIGALIPTLSNPVFAEAIDGLQSICQQEHYQLLVACSRYEPDEEAKAVATLLAHRIDGLILTVSNAQDSPAITTALKAGVPFVLIFNHPDRALPAVAFNNHAAAQEVAQAMLDLGHRDVGFVAGRFRGSDRSKQRYAGFRQRYLAAGAPSPALLEVGYETASYRGELSALLQDRPGLTALFCSNDLLALRITADLKRLQIGVPDDISVVGFDGLDIGTLVDPGLATVATDCARMGAEAAERLIGAIHNNHRASDHISLLPHEFRPGPSLARVRSG